jgi:hypothetical protein
MRLSVTSDCERAAVRHHSDVVRTLTTPRSFPGNLMLSHWKVSHQGVAVTCYIDWSATINSELNCPDSGINDFERCLPFDWEVPCLSFPRSKVNERGRKCSSTMPQFNSVSSRFNVPKGNLGTTKQCASLTTANMNGYSINFTTVDSQAYKINWKLNHR